MSETNTLGFVEMIPYPQGGLRFIVRLPLLLYQLGLGDLLHPLGLMVLTTRGRNTGLSRRTVLECRQHGSKLYAISGWREYPHWVKNAQAHPDVTVQYGQRDRAARATIVQDTAEALRVLYMFQRTGRLNEVILANMSQQDSIDLRTLKRVANEFTVIRFDLHNEAPPMRGLQPIHPVVPWLIRGLCLLLGSMGIYWITARLTRTN